MASRKQAKSTNDNYADSFKPVVVFNLPSTDEMLNRTFLREDMEAYDEQNNQMMYSNLGYLGATTNPDAMSLYTFEVSDPTVTPNVRQVVVKGKEDYQNNSYVLEPQIGARGIIVLMMKKMDSLDQVFCNVRILPYTQFNDIVTDTSGPLVTVSIPRSNVVKLNVTLMSTSVGELVYRTHKTEVEIDNLTDADVVNLKNELEFKTAEYIAQFATLVLSPEATETGMTLNFESDAVGGLSPTFKKGLLGVSLICTAGGLALTYFVPGMVPATAFTLGVFLRAVVTYDNLNLQQRNEARQQNPPGPNTPLLNDLENPIVAIQY